MSLPSSSSFRDVSVDLSSKHAKKALEVLLQMEKRRTKVRSARVFSQTGHIYTPTTSDGSVQVPAGKVLAEIFELLSRLPNLKYLTVSFGFSSAVPLQAICFLARAPRLKSLVLESVHLTIGGTKDDTAQDASQDVDETDSKNPLWSQILSTSEQLQELTLQHCRGNEALQRLLSVGLPSSLKKLTIANTPIGQNGTTLDNSRAKPCTTTSTIQALIQNNPQLTALRLWDLPNLQDEHVQVLADALLMASASSSSASHALQELELTSSILGPPAGEVLANLLMDSKNSNHNNISIEHLKLHLDWEDCGNTVAQLLLTVKQLKHLDLRLYGDDDNVRADALAIAEALSSSHSSSGLKRLRVCMELEPEQVAGDELIMEAFDRMLQSNDTLKYLVLDDSLEDFPLPATVHAKLQLNRSGAPRLWKRHTPASQAQYVQALANASQRDDLNTLYQILSNQPTLCVGAGDNDGSTPEVVSSDDDEGAFYLHVPTSASGRKTLSSLSPKRTIYKSRKFLKKQMKTIFAISA